MLCAQVFVCTPTVCVPILSIQTHSLCAPIINIPCARKPNAACSLLHQSRHACKQRSFATTTASKHDAQRAWWELQAYIVEEGCRGACGMVTKPLHHQCRWRRCIGFLCSCHFHQSLDNIGKQAVELLCILLRGCRRASCRYRRAVVPQ